MIVKFGKKLIQDSFCSRSNLPLTIDSCFSVGARLVTFPFPVSCFHFLRNGSFW